MNKKKSFTLLELLVVIALATVLLSMVVAGFANFGEAAKVGNAATVIGQELTLAKSAAATKRKPVAMVLADRSINGSSVACPLAAVRCGVVDLSGNNIDWLPDSEWTLLPYEVRVSDVLDASDASILDSISINIDGDDDTMEKVFVFTPDGVCHSLNTGADWSIGSARSFNIRVAECIDENGGEPSEDNYKMVKINRYTGVVKYEDPEVL